MVTRRRLPENSEQANRMSQTCKENGCEDDVHVNMNGIRFNKCRKHYLKSMSTLRD